MQKSLIVKRGEISCVLFESIASPTHQWQQPRLTQTLSSSIIQHLSIRISIIAFVPGRCFESETKSPRCEWLTRISEPSLFVLHYHFQDTIYSRNIPRHNLNHPWMIPFPALRFPKSPTSHGFQDSPRCVVPKFIGFSIVSNLENCWFNQWLLGGECLVVHSAIPMRRWSFLREPWFTKLTL